MGDFRRKTINLLANAVLLIGITVRKYEESLLSRFLIF